MDKLPLECFVCPAFDTPDCPIMPCLTDREIEWAYLVMEEQADRYYLSLVCN